METKAVLPKKREAKSDRERFAGEMKKHPIKQGKPLDFGIKKKRK
jgi:hypothetical protein